MDLGEKRLEDLEAVASLVVALRGNRSNRELSRDSGVSAASISRYINKLQKISPKNIGLLTAPEAHPCNNVTSHDLLVAAGYSKDVAYLEYAEGGMEYSVEKNDDSLKRFRAYYETFAAIRAQKEAVKYADETISNMLWEYGYKTKKNYPKTTTGLFYTPDFCFLIENSRSYNKGKSLYFTIINDDRIETNNINSAKPLLSNVLFSKPSADHRITLVTYRENVYELFRSLKGSLSFKGDLTIALLDKNTGKFTKEEFLSFFDESTKESRFFLLSSKRRKRKENVDQNKNFISGCLEDNSLVDKIGQLPTT